MKEGRRAYVREESAGLLLSRILEIVSRRGRGSGMHYAGTGYIGIFNIVPRDCAD